jgi:hypothetical protein
VREYLNVTTNGFLKKTLENFHTMVTKKHLDFFFFFSGKFEKNGKFC